MATCIVTDCRFCLRISCASRTVGKGKEAADKGTVTGDHQLPLARSTSAPAELPEDSRTEAPSSRATEGEAPLPVHIFGPQNCQTHWSVAQECFPNAV